ncbi:MAG: flagellar hook-length control protein FliK [Clostridiales bacterium]|nr:flagellar hook-length control protein FliK [Clostridiales bacterium]
MMQIGAFLPTAPQNIQPDDLSNKKLSADLTNQGESFEQLLSAEVEINAEQKLASADEAVEEITTESGRKEEKDELPLFQQANPLAIDLIVNVVNVVNENAVNQADLQSMADLVENTEKASVKAVEVQPMVDYKAVEIADNSQQYSQVQQVLPLQQNAESKVEAFDEKVKVAINSFEKAPLEAKVVETETTETAKANVIESTMEFTTSQKVESEAVETPKTEGFNEDLLSELKLEVKTADDATKNTSDDVKSQATQETGVKTPENVMQKDTVKTEQTSQQFTVGAEDDEKIEAKVETEIIGSTVESDNVKAEAKDTAEKTDKNTLGEVASSIKPNEIYRKDDVIVEKDELPQEVKAPVNTQIIDNIKTCLEEGRKEFVMELNPATLGKVLVKLVSESGKLTVQLAAYNPKTQALLMAGSEDIKNILQADTMQKVVVEENQNAQWHEQNANQQQQQQEQQQRENNENKKNQEFSANDFINFMQLMRASL